MKDVRPQNVEENRKIDANNRLKEKRALKRQQKVDAVTNNSFFKRLKTIYNSKWFFWFGIICWIHLIYKFSSKFIFN
ncbi:MAG: hypothetical protein ACN6OV_08470 [Acinetobacter sp.]|uniref:hypothetical protein n=1 Tax=Acinetobacter sp. TaxID=472 RepID=UPI003CFE0B2B